MSLINQVEATRPEPLSSTPSSQPITAPSERFHNHLARSPKQPVSLPTTNALPGLVANNASMESISSLAAQYALQSQFESIDF